MRLLLESLNVKTLKCKDMRKDDNYRLLAIYLMSVVMLIVAMVILIC